MPTGLSASPPAGPAIPVMATLTSAWLACNAPSAISAAVSMLTAPKRAKVSARTPKTSHFEALEYTTNPRSKPARAARHCGNGLGQPTPGAGLGRDQLIPPRTQGPSDCLGQPVHGSLSDGLISAWASRVPAAFLEKQLQYLPARLTEAAALHLYPVIQAFRTEHREHATGGTAFGVRAPKTTRARRAWMMAPAHMTQGSKVTYKAAPGRR